MAALMLYKIGGWEGLHVADEDGLFQGGQRVGAFRHEFLADEAFVAGRHGLHRR
jgi:hypothetical protein